MDLSRGVPFSARVLAGLLCRPAHTKSGPLLGLGLAQELQEIGHRNQAPVNRGELGYIQLQPLDILVKVDRGQRRIRWRRGDSR